MKISTDTKNLICKKCGSTIIAITSSARQRRHNGGKTWYYADIVIYCSCCGQTVELEDNDGQ